MICITTENKQPISSSLQPKSIKISWNTVRKPLQMVYLTGDNWPFFCNMLMHQIGLYQMPQTYLPNNSILLNKFHSFEPYFFHASYNCVNICCTPITNLQVSFPRDKEPTQVDQISCVSAFLCTATHFLPTTTTACKVIFSRKIASHPSQQSFNHHLKKLTWSWTIRWPPRSGFLNHSNSDSSNTKAVQYTPQSPSLVNMEYGQASTHSKQWSVQMHPPKQGSSKSIQGKYSSCTALIPSSVDTVN